MDLVKLKLLVRSAIKAIDEEEQGAISGEQLSHRLRALNLQIQSEFGCYVPKKPSILQQHKGD